MTHRDWGNGACGTIHGHDRRCHACAPWPGGKGNRLRVGKEHRRRVRRQLGFFARGLTEIHFWGYAWPVKLAPGINAALERNLNRRAPELALFGVVPPPTWPREKP